MDSLHRSPIICLCLFGFFLASVQATTIAAAPARTNCPTGLREYRMALRAHQDGLFDPATAGLEAFLKQCPHDSQAPQARYLLATIWYSQQRYAEAVTLAASVLATPSAAALHPYAALLSGQSLLQQGLPAEAQPMLQRALVDSAPSEVRAAALYWLGDMALQRQQYLEAQTYYEQLLQTQGTGAYAVSASYALGMVFRRLGNLPAALHAFSTFLTLAPDHALAPQAGFNRAMLLRETGVLPEAIAAFQELAQTAPPTLQDEVFFWWAETAYQSGQYAQAQAVYQRLVDAYPQSPRVLSSLYGQGWTAIQRHDCVAAMPPWDELLRREPQWPQALELHYHLGVCSAQMDQPPAAQAHFRQVVAAGPETVYYRDSLLQLAALVLQQGDHRQAIQYYTQTLALVDHDASFAIHYLLGESYAALDQPAPAMEHWAQALHAPPTFPWRAQALFRLGSAYGQRQEWRQALPLLQELWEEVPAFPDRATVARQLIQAYNALQRCEAAFPLYDALLHDPTEGEQYQSIRTAAAGCLLNQGHYSEVVQLLALEPMAASAPLSDPQTLYILAQALLQLRQYPVALEPLRALYDRFPRTPLAILAAPGLALALEKTGQREAALPVWKVYLEQAPSLASETRFQTQLYAGRLAAEAGQHAVALEFLAPVCDAPFPALAAAALFWSGEVAFQQQEWELALQRYQTVFDRYPTMTPWHTLAHLRLGVTYEQQQEWARALHTYQLLQSSTTDAEVLGIVQQRIVAIEAGRVFKPMPPLPLPTEG